MQRVTQLGSLRMRAAGIGVGVIAAMVVLTGSCFFDTKTNFCGTSGLRCPPGWVCSLEQDACIEAGMCGDGSVSGLEACDDGNLADGDGCSADCRSNETCGNDILDVVAGESCDDGNILSGDNCSPDCKLEACSNRVVDVNEECDSGGLDTKGCNVDCTFVRCGDKYVNSMADEQCDDGMDPSPTCNSPLLCTVSKCGDGIYNSTAGEECDTGGDSQACNGGDPINGMTDSFCKIPKCGDHYKNKSLSRPPPDESRSATRANRTRRAATRIARCRSAVTITGTRWPEKIATMGTQPTMTTVFPLEASAKMQGAAMAICEPQAPVWSNAITVMLKTATPSQTPAVRIAARLSVAMG